MNRECDLQAYKKTQMWIKSLRLDALKKAKKKKRKKKKEKKKKIKSKGN